MSSTAEQKRIERIREYATQLFTTITTYLKTNTKYSVRNDTIKHHSTIQSWLEKEGYHVKPMVEKVTCDCIVDVCNCGSCMCSMYGEGYTCTCAPCYHRGHKCKDGVQYYFEVTD